MVSLIVISGTLDIMALLFTVFLLGFGFLRGYAIIELMTYNIYFIVVLLNQIVHLKIISKKRFKTVAD
ncbi:hypothetical protein J4443_04010 [Candidatus Woesearchaeota archaeon]|nr:hypothetical protein [Candidatus Woesearchaeota archaeon]